MDTQPELKQPEIPPDPTKSFPPKPGQYRSKRKWYNWAGLKQEWITRNIKESLSLNIFRKEKGIANQNVFYNNVKRFNWKEDCEKLKARSLEKIESKISNEIAAKYARQFKIYDTGEKQAEFILNKNIHKESDEILYPMDATELATVMLAAYRALCGKRMIDNLPNLITEERHMLLGLIQLKNGLDNNNPQYINSTHTINEMVDTNLMPDNAINDQSIDPDN